MCIRDSNSIEEGQPVPFDKFNDEFENIYLGGDDLSVAFEPDDDSLTNVRLTGPAEFVFSGQIEI